MLTNRYGNPISKVDTAVYDQESGEIVGAFCLRKDAFQARRYYRVTDLRHPDGLAGVVAALEAAPTKITEAECDAQVVY
jgi:hypothetical protein